MRLDERVCTTLHNSVSQVAHHCCGLSGARVAISKVVVVIWMLVVALDAVLWAIAEGDVGVGSCDVATELCSSRGWGSTWGVRGCSVE
jgi:hypothetical protein